MLIPTSCLSLAQHFPFGNQKFLFKIHESLSVFVNKFMCITVYNYTVFWQGGMKVGAESEATGEQHGLQRCTRCEEGKDWKVWVADPSRGPLSARGTGWISTVIQVTWFPQAGKDVDSLRWTPLMPGSPATYSWDLAFSSVKWEEIVAFLQFLAFYKKQEGLLRGSNRLWEPWEVCALPPLPSDCWPLFTSWFSKISDGAGYAPTNHVGQPAWSLMVPTHIHTAHNPLRQVHTL